MVDNANTLREFLTGLKTPLEFFYQWEQQTPDSTCFIQPYPNGEIEELSWGDVATQVRSMANYLKSLDLPEHSNIALMSNNCAHWIMADLAIWMAGHCSVPLYPVLAEKTIKQIMEHSESKLLFVGKLTGWEEMEPGVPEQTPIITLPLCPNVERPSKAWSDIVESTSPMQESPVYPIENIATIVYTSGTTGMPKGVMHSFQNMSVVGTLSSELYKTDQNDRKISYLPLAHVAERVATEISQLVNGYPVYFSNSLETFADDLRRARPTTFFAVPRIWSKLQQRVLAQIKDEDLQKMLADPQRAEAVKNKLLSGMGFDQLRIAIGGAAPLSTSLIDWYKRLGIEILEGYAMSENLAYSHTSKPGLAKTGYVGTPSRFVECRLSEEGEVLVKSPANMIGYYKEPELTAQAIDKDGYLHTGDKGVIDEKDRLKITGRIKELFKTSKGKYIAPAPIEDKLAQNLNIELVCVTGANLTQPIALINLSLQAKELVKNGGKEALIDSLLTTLQSANQSLDKHENVSHLIITGDDWTVDNNLITPTLKVKRGELDVRYSDQYSQWQSSSEQIIFQNDD